MDPKATFFIPGSKYWKSNKGHDQASNSPQASLGQQRQGGANSIIVPHEFRTTLVPRGGVPCQHPIRKNGCWVKPGQPVCLAYHSNGKTSLWETDTCVSGYMISSLHVQRDGKNAKARGYPEGSRYPSSSFIRKGCETIAVNDLTEEQFEFISTIIGASKGYITESGVFRCRGEHFDLAPFIEQNIQHRDLQLRTLDWCKHQPTSLRPCSHSFCVDSTFIPQLKGGEPVGDKQSELSEVLLTELSEDPHAMSIARSTVLDLLEDDI